MLSSVAVPGSGTLPLGLAQGPFTLVSPAKVFAVSAYTQPLIVPASTPLPTDPADIVKLVPARMFPSKVIGPELPTLIVAASSTTQKMLLVCAPPSSVNVIAPFTVRAPPTRITKTSLGLPWASNVKLMPVAVEMSVADAYALLPMNVWLVIRVPSGHAVDTSARAWVAGVLC